MNTHLNSVTYLRTGKPGAIRGRKATEPQRQAWSAGLPKRKHLRGRVLPFALAFCFSGMPVGSRAVTMAFEYQDGAAGIPGENALTTESGTVVRRKATNELPAAPSGQLRRTVASPSDFPGPAAASYRFRLL